MELHIIYVVLAENSLETVIAQLFSQSLIGVIILLVFILSDTIIISKWKKINSTTPLIGEWHLFNKFNHLNICRLRYSFDSQVIRGNSSQGY